jgi:cyclopropane-fatty-acyl-phospholipid synthase
MSAVSKSFARRIFLRGLRSFAAGSLELIENGETLRFGGAGPLCATVVVHHQRFYRRALFGGDVGLGESWMDGDWSSPDLVSVVRLAVRNLASLEKQNAVWNAFSRALEALRHPAQHSRALRFEQRLLPLVSRPRHDVFLRLLQRRGRFTGSGPVSEAGSHLP